MLRRTLNYISHHAIAILALVCALLALAGASYAAITLPKNSVGNPQIKRGAVAPPKFSKQIGGYVRAYAVVSAAGKLLYSSPKASLTNWGESSTTPSGGTISWKATASARRCTAFATAQSGSTPTPVNANLLPDVHGSASGTHAFVVFNGPVQVAVEVVC